MKFWMFSDDDTEVSVSVTDYCLVNYLRCKGLKTVPIYYSQRCCKLGVRSSSAQQFETWVSEVPVKVLVFQTKGLIGAGGPVSKMASKVAMGRRSFQLFENNWSWPLF